MNPRGRVWSERVRVGLLGFAVCASMIEGCAGRERRAAMSQPKPGYFSGFPTLGSDLKSAPRGVSIPPSGVGVDLVGGWRGKMSKMVDDAIGQVAAPGFANIR